MQLQLISCSENKLTAKAPTTPNLNDKQTIFGGSSSALMTVCGWSLIKFNLEQRGFNNDVVIANAQTRWHKAQNDDLIISAQGQVHWPDIIAAINNRQQPKITADAQVINQRKQICTNMSASYVILNQVKG